MKVDLEYSAYHALREKFKLHSRFGKPDEQDLNEQFQRLYLARNRYLLRDLERMNSATQSAGYPKHSLNTDRNPAQPRMDYPEGTHHFNLWRDKELGFTPLKWWHFLAK